MIYVDPDRDQSADRRQPGEDPRVRLAANEAERAVTRLIAFRLRLARVLDLEAELARWDYSAA